MITSTNFIKRGSGIGSCPTR